MITKYKTNYSKDKIVEVDVIRETDQSVFVKTLGYQLKGNTEHRVSKRSEHECYFDTFEDAKKFLIDAAERRVSWARNSLQDAQDKLGNIKGMKGPAK